jgi:hypothetical protein
MTKGLFTAALAATIILMFDTASAGFLSSGLSDTDAASFKRLAVISALGDTLKGRTIGLTVFNNKSFQTTLPNRDLADSFTADMKSTITAGGRFKGEVAALSSASLDTDSILAAAREQGFDAVVAMQPAEDTQFHMTDPGLSVWRTGGGQKSFTCNSMQIVLLRVSDGKQIASASDYRCPSYSNLPFWHNSWEEYTEDEKATVFGAMKVFVAHQIDQTLKKLKLNVP